MCRNSRKALFQAVSEHRKMPPQFYQNYGGIVFRLDKCIILIQFAKSIEKPTFLHYMVSFVWRRIIAERQA